MEIIDEIEMFIEHFKKTSFSAEEIRNILIAKSGRKSLMYPSIASKYLKSFYDAANMLGYGKYDIASMRFILNNSNEKIGILLLKHGVLK